MNTKTEKKLTLQELQFQFTARAKDPEHHDIPENIDPNRMQVYEELLFSNLHEQFRFAFPVIYRILDETTWNEMIRDFLIKHQSTTGIFHQLPQEFLSYLQNERDNSDDPPFLLELAHYEWVELALELSSDVISFDNIDKKSDLLNGQVVLSPLAWLFRYQFPVHRISPEFQPSENEHEATFLIVFRTRDDIVKFMEINVVAARMTELIEEGNLLNSYDILVKIHKELDNSNLETILDQGKSLLEQFRSLDIILGTKQ